jgi:hypothetical protein
MKNQLMAIIMQVPLEADPRTVGGYTAEYWFYVDKT